MFQKQLFIKMDMNQVHYTQRQYIITYSTGGVWD